METMLGVNMLSRIANVLGKIRLFREINILSGRDPLEFLEGQAEKNERAQRRGTLRRVLSDKSIVLTVISSGFGFLPKLDHIDTDRNRNLVVWRVREAVEETKSVYRYARRQATTAGQLAQLRKLENPMLEGIPGFQARPIDFFDPSVRSGLYRASRGE